ncbi:MAG TPA: c-type cytochrome [Caulobacteraceae bacterium]|jgi:cytochrome c oxidase subunit 2
MAGPADISAGRAWPMNYLWTHGPRADPATALTWAMIVLSTAVVVIVTLLVVAGVAVRGNRRLTVAEAPVKDEGDGLAWISIGLVLTVIALAGTLVWTLEALAAIDSPARPPALTLEIIGHEWWWEVRYLGAGPGQSFSTANEIHIPVGVPVRVWLKGADVIHSFWIPALTGKTETIPGRTNLTWLQADRPGVYRGQCTEYCGAQHAHMAAFVIAEPAAAFAAWLRSQEATPAVDPEFAAGQAVFQASCAKCHAVRGTSAHGDKGPDLTHLMSRRTLAAGVVPNDVDGLSGWIANPQALKPGALMPATYLSGPQLARLRAYLESLK